MLITDDNQAGVGKAFNQIREKSASGLARGVGIHNVNLRFGRLKIAEVRSKRGFQLFGDDLELGFIQKTFELAQNQRMRGEQADG